MCNQWDRRRTKRALLGGCRMEKRQDKDEKAHHSSREGYLCRIRATRHQRNQRYSAASFKAASNIGTRGKAYAPPPYEWHVFQPQQRGLRARNFSEPDFTGLILLKRWVRAARRAGSFRVRRYARGARRI